MEKKLYPLKFVPVPSVRPWGGNALVNDLGKSFVECDDEGNETVLGADVRIGESWELADMGKEDSVTILKQNLQLHLRVKILMMAVALFGI